MCVTSTAQLHGRPITLEGSRALDCYAGLQADGDCQTADAAGARLQARLKGRPTEGYLFANFAQNPNWRCAVLCYCCTWAFPDSHVQAAIGKIMLTTGCWLSIGCKLVTLSVRSSRKNINIKDTLRAWAGRKPELPHAWAELFQCFNFADPSQPVSQFVGSEEILSREHADVATFLVKQVAYIDTVTRKYMDEIGADRLPRCDTLAVKLAANDASSMGETSHFVSNCGAVVLRSRLLSDGWTKRQDATLHRLMGYLAATRSSAPRLVLNPVDVQQRPLRLVLWVDSEWATDPGTRRSTSGAALQHIGSHGTLSAPDAVSRSTGFSAQDLFEFFVGVSSFFNHDRLRNKHCSNR